MITEVHVFVEALQAHEIADRSAKTVEIDGRKIAIARVGERYFAVDALCSHMGVPLDKGSVDGHEIVCPWHAARFCLQTGAKKRGPGFCDLGTYPVRVSDGVVAIGIPEAPSAPMPVPAAIASRPEGAPLS